MCKDSIVKYKILRPKALNYLAFKVYISEVFSLKTLEFTSYENWAVNLDLNYKYFPVVYCSIHQVSHK